VRYRASIVGLVITLLACTGLWLFQSSLKAKAKPHTVFLHWNPPVPKKGEKAMSYNVYRSLTSGGSYARIASGVRNPAYTDKQVASGTTYFYVVTAVDDVGRESKYSNEIKVHVPAAGP
jgi:predicted phage tail protein